jgi:prepilin peptidase CpaA
MTANWVAIAALVVTGSYAVWSDVRSRRLPNLLCLLVGLLGLAHSLFFGGLGMAGSGLAHGAAALVVGALLFGFGIVGGGDAKYYAASAIWYPIDQAASLLFYVSVTGLILFAAWFAMRRLRGIKILKSATSDSDKFPYGVAIAIGSLAVTIGLGGPSLFSHPIALR